MEALLLASMIVASSPEYTESFPITGSHWLVRCDSKEAVAAFDTYIQGIKNAVDNDPTIEAQLGFKPLPVALEILITPHHVFDFNKTSGGDHCTIVRWKSPTTQGG